MPEPRSPLGRWRDERVLMSLFPLIFISLMVLAHLYIFLNMRRAFAPGAWQYGFLAIMLVGLASMFLRRRMAALPHGEQLINFSFLWMGAVAILAMGLACRDVLQALARLADRLGAADWSRWFTGPGSVRVALLVGVLGCAYALFEAYHVRVSEIAIETDRLPPGTGALRIIAASDIHLTTRGDGARLKRLVNRINAEKPDIFLSLGDLVDDWIIDRDDLSSDLLRITAPMGKFAILGNHELYSGMEQSIRFLEKSGFTMIRGKTLAAGPVEIAGVDDPALGGRVEIADALRGAKMDRFVLLLTHRPETPSVARGLFDLQLSGHTHGGQMLPARLLTWLQTGHGQGLKTLPAADGAADRSSRLYLSNGAGYWGIPMRLFAPPEIVVITLTRTTR